MSLDKARKFSDQISKERQKETGEVFTPEDLVEKILDMLPDEDWSEDKLFCDTFMGDGNFLIAILKRKIKLGHNPTKALSTIYGVDLMEDNVKMTRLRLLELVGTTKEHKKIVNKNLVCDDSFTYNFKFKEKSEAAVDLFF